MPSLLLLSPLLHFYHWHLTYFSSNKNSLLIAHGLKTVILKLIPELLLFLPQHILHKQKPFARDEIFLIFVHLPCTYSPPFLYRSKCSIAFWRLLAHGSILLLIIFSFEQLTINVVFLRFTFSLVFQPRSISKAFLSHSRCFHSLRPSHQHTKFHTSYFLFTFSVIVSTAIAMTSCHNTDSWCTPTCTENSADNFNPALTLFWFLERRSSSSLSRIDSSLAFVTIGDFIF